MTTSIRRLVLFFTVLFGTLHAWKHELALTLGSVRDQERSLTSARLRLSQGLALQANYGYLLHAGKVATVYVETHFLANPQRRVTSANSSLTRDIATLYLTPGLRIKLFPASRLSPWAAIGGGYALYEQRTFLLSGTPNPAARHLNRGALDFGGGVDIRAWKMFSLRAEIRDFYAGSPAYNTRAISGGQHNVVAGGGLVLRFP